MPILNPNIPPFGFVFGKNYFSRMNQEDAMEKRQVTLDTFDEDTTSHSFHVYDESLVMNYNFVFESNFY